jgi:hypothetical protein
MRRFYYFQHRERARWFLVILIGMVLFYPTRKIEVLPAVWQAVKALIDPLFFMVGGIKLSELFYF